MKCSFPYAINRGMYQARRLVFYSVVHLLALNAENVLAHGSVAASDDSCLIQIGYLQAHFKIYLPRTHRYQEFCEDLPEVTESLFVMEYAHDALKEMSIDFRIVRDTSGQGKFTRLSDIEQLEDLEAVTVFHQPALIEPDVYTVVHQFDEPGWYIGVITATRGNQKEVAVFPFEVGFTGLGYWPLFVLLIVLLQLFHWFANGTLARWLEKLTTGQLEVKHDI